MHANVFTALLGMALLTVTINAAVMRGEGDCPNNLKPGDVWYPEGCMKCSCHVGGYGCTGCGVASIGLSEDGKFCHLVEDKTADYPNCCPTIQCK